mgnify:CR=1 FL=1|tara:strand:+ start:4693 stop:5646 length:954 start_codon:yes stop_codon:yes gene_type:complete
MAKTIVTSAEREKRDLVANIAARGREAYKAKEDTVKPTQDLAAAASAAVKADPVDIPSDAMESLIATSGAPVADASRYAEAQRAIFESGRGREQEYMGERYGGGHDRMVTGTNYALDQYDKDLAEAEAARRASLASNNIPDLTPDDMIEGRWGFREGTPAWDNNRVGPDMEVGMGRIDLSEEETGLLLNAFSAYPSIGNRVNTYADDMFRDALRGGSTMTQAVNGIVGILVAPDGDYGLDVDTALSFLNPWMRRWEPAFIDQMQRTNPELSAARRSAGSVQRATPKRFGRPSDRASIPAETTPDWMTPKPKNDTWAG